MKYILQLVLLVPIFLQGQDYPAVILRDSVTGWVTNRAVPKEVVRSSRLFRERLLADAYRPGYHFAITDDVAIPGDPNGAFYFNGRYHLMYLYLRNGYGFFLGTHFEYRPLALEASPRRFVAGKWR